MKNKDNTDKIEKVIKEFKEKYKNNKNLSFALAQTKGEQLLQSILCDLLNEVNDENSLYLTEFKKIDIAEIKDAEIHSILECKVAYLSEFFSHSKLTWKKYLSGNRYNLDNDIKKRIEVYGESININGIWIIKNIYPTVVKDKQKYECIAYNELLTRECHNKELLITSMKEKGFKKINIDDNISDGIFLQKYKNFIIELLFFYK